MVEDDSAMSAWRGMPGPFSSKKFQWSITTGSNSTCFSPTPSWTLIKIPSSLLGGKLFSGAAPFVDPPGSQLV